MIEVRSALQGPVSVEVEVEAGCASEGRLTVHEVDPLAHPGIDTLARGEGVAFVGLRLVSPGHARPGAGFRASWAGANEGAASPDPLKAAGFGTMRKVGGRDGEGE